MTSPHSKWRRGHVSSVRRRLFAPLLLLRRRCRRRHISLPLRLWWISPRCRRTVIGGGRIRIEGGVLLLLLLLHGETVAAAAARRAGWDAGCRRCRCRCTCCCCCRIAIAQFRHVLNGLDPLYGIALGVVQVIRAIWLQERERQRRYKLAQL